MRLHHGLFKRGAVRVVGAYDSESNSKIELALARTSWKIRAQRLLDDSHKPSIQVLQRHLKEVSIDGGALGLDKGFELIMEGESLPVSCEKELKLLRDQIMLYCLCRKPYDQRPMLACDKCDEWYHFDCIKRGFCININKRRREGHQWQIRGKTEKQMLPLEGVKTQLTGKTFSIQVKKSFLNTNASTGKLITVSFMEKENTVNTRPSRIAMDIEESGKRKIENGGTGTTNS
ncbi:hypothetical protein P3S68_015809 [Capsicum galapagoense]